MQKDGLSEDEAKDAGDRIQKLIDEFTEKVEKIVAAKEEEIMTI
jgi:ribosome recycling factor